MRRYLLLALLAVVAGFGLRSSATSAAVKPQPTVPASIPANCSADATAPLNAYFARLPSRAIVRFPPNACYLVSDSTSSVLTIADAKDLTVLGSGTTLKQTTYSGRNDTQPVLTLRGDVGLRLQNVRLDGPSSSGGAEAEGDYGLMVTDGNRDVTLADDTIENTDGDGLAVYPNLATNTGVNTDVAFVHGTLANIGYHGVTLEGVDGFRFAHNHVSSVGNFIDLEVDAACGTPSRCYATAGSPRGAGELDVTVTANTFANSRHGDFIESAQACVPAKNWSFSNNNLGDAPLTGFVDGACGASDPNVGLTIEGNTSTSAGGGAWGGSMARPPTSALFTVSNVTGFTFSANTEAAADGTAMYYPNTPVAPALGLCGVARATIKGNIMNDVWAPWILGGGNAASGPITCQADRSNTDIVSCGNTYWLTEPINGAPAEPKRDRPCSVRGTGGEAPRHPMCNEARLTVLDIGGRRRDADRRGSIGRCTAITTSMTSERSSARLWSEALLVAEHLGLGKTIGKASSSTKCTSSAGLPDASSPTGVTTWEKPGR